MNRDTATEKEFAKLVELDHHISKDILAKKLDAGEIIVAMDDLLVIGWLQYGHFWDITPFRNMLVVRKDRRGRR